MLSNINNQEDEQRIDIDVDKQQLKLSLTGHIRFEKLGFTYPSRENEPVLNEINFEVSPNQVVALVGASGAGKSTIAI